MRRGAVRKLRTFVLGAAALALATTAAAPLSAQRIARPAELAPMAESFRQAWKQTDKPVRMSIPLHGGVLEFAMPHGFVPAFRIEHEGQFMMVFMPDGEVWPHFTRAVFVQSSAGLSAAPHSTAEIAEGVFRPTSCAGESLWQPLGEEPLGSAAPAFLVASGCPSLADNPAEGQQTFLAFMRGSPEAVALYHARRGPAFDADKPPLTVEQGRVLIAEFGEMIFCEKADQPKCKDIWARDQIRRGLGKP